MCTEALFTSGGTSQAHPHIEALGRSWSSGAAPTHAPETRWRGSGGVEKPCATRGEGRGKGTCKREAKGAEGHMQKEKRSSARNIEGRDEVYLCPGEE